ncbi:MAG: ATP-binding protein, partial [Scytonema sp. PMC 1069.18]|nr:ATP-binding protein [Scytonema sp. PMC 1069.18]
VGVGKIVIPQYYFYDSLTQLAMYPTVDETEQKEILDKVQANQEKMQHWARYAPMNFSNKFYLVEAERHRVRGEFLEAIECYEQAIELAKKHEYIHEASLANELAAKFYLNWRKPKIAQSFLTEAYYGYSRWGAKAKVKDLENRYPQLLMLIIQQENLNLESTLNPYFDNSLSSTHSNTQTIISSNTSLSNSLDLAAVIKASVALSGEIELEQLLSTLIQVVMENAGASKCTLILNEGDRLNLVVTAINSNSSNTHTQIEFPSIPLESSQDIPVALINYVKRTQEILVIDDLKDKPILANDSYIARQKPKSLLCVPIINQAKLLGILYLENNLTTAVFTQNRVELLKLITTQAAISLENAILYQNLAKANECLEEYSHTLEEKVTQRTQELHEKNQCLQQALQELKQAQIQLIQSEKMSSLGQMVAGLAHEINNPINFIHGNISHASVYVKDLLDLLEVYQQEYPNFSPLIQAKNREIDLPFLLEDLPKILESMNIGTTRIRHIVLGLRNFSRLDEAEMKPVDIHEGIDNTLMILHHRLKAKSVDTKQIVDKYLPEIEVIKEYGQLPLVECYPGQLNQVFMNIMVNAIDALEEGVGKTLNPTPKIFIHTRLKDNKTIEIRIADNGCGMVQEVKQKIFDPFFTTKPVGNGTGLGLSISYQIVVEQHKGSLTCNSTPGDGTEFVIQIPLHR